MALALCTARHLLLGGGRTHAHDDEIILLQALGWTCDTPDSHYELVAMSKRAMRVRIGQIMRCTHLISPPLNPIVYRVDG